MLQQRNKRGDLLIHARFRAEERSRQAQRLYEEDSTDRIVVATQAIEAGVDVSARTLITELAPWPSLVQRFGRCNRYGEHNSSGASIIWVDIEDHEDLSSPYDVESLALARKKLISLDRADPEHLPRTDTERPLTAVLRRKDLLDLFNTDPDLSGFDVDVSDYIRDSGLPGVHVFWREFKDDPNTPAEGKPHRAELCPISMSQAKDIHKRGAWVWDTLDARWIKLESSPRPGMTLLLRASDGGYDQIIGFDATQNTRPVPVVQPPAAQVQRQIEESFGNDESSRQTKPIELAEHLRHVAQRAKELCALVGEDADCAAVVRAARWHDVGKAHPVFQASMYSCKGQEVGKTFLAKSDCPGPVRHQRKFFRHELASMLAWLDQHDGEADADLVAYLIAAHHGKVRLSLRAMPTEPPAANGKRFARGIWEGDILPAVVFDGERSEATVLRLALMEIGEGEQGPSWAERTLKLLEQYGPFRLAWLEALVRLADWRASAEVQ